MEQEISQNCASILKHLKNKHDIEQEARLGKFFDTKFIPGVDKEYFNACKQLLLKFPTNPKRTYSIAFYFDDGLRAERFQQGKIETIRKYKIAEDIDIHTPGHYSLRVSTSKEDPVNLPVLNREIERFLKPKKIPKLYQEGNLFKFREGSVVYYHRKPCKVNDFNNLSWKSSYPCVVTNTQRKKVVFQSKQKLKPETYVKLTCLAGEMQGKPVPMAYYTVKARLCDLVPLCSFTNVETVAPFIPTSWRKKERISFTLWKGMTIDLTKTTFTKSSLQHCFDNRGIIHYEMEADWDTNYKDSNEFAKAVCSILFTL